MIKEILHNLAALFPPDEVFCILLLRNPKNHDFAETVQVFVLVPTWTVFGKGTILQLGS
jgi:hypothetical protein